jgi:hypothetical protein
MKRNKLLMVGTLAMALVFSSVLVGCKIDAEDEEGNTQKNAKMLTANTWTDGNISSSSGEQWFKFNLTANPQFIHINYDTLTNVYVEMFDEDENRIGNGLNIYGNSGSIGGIRWSFGLLSSVDVGDMVYVKITAFSGTGTYQIAFNSTSYHPNAIITTLTPNTWTNGSFASSSDEQWFKFSPTSSGTHYIHVKFGSLTDLNIRLYSANDMLGSWINLFSGGRSYENNYLSSGSVYYIRVMPNSSSGPGSGTYQIAFNTSSTAP